MNPVAYAALIAWPIVAVALWAILRGPRAAVATAALGWMLLPQGGISIPGPIDGSKMNFICLSMLVGLLAFDGRRVLGIRWSILDLPMLGVCVCAFFSSMDNGLGPYDGFAESLVRVVIWGVPWLVGRACFTSLADMRVLAWGVVLAGLVYVPLCLYEVRMSPQLHRMLYGFFPHAEFAQTRRFGGFRPTVFMEHGLMVGLWMCLSALTGTWLWLGGRSRALLGLPMWIVAGVQGATAVLCKSAGALALAAGGGAVLMGARTLRMRLPLLALCLLPAGFVAYRVAGLPTDVFVSAVSAVPALGERSDSLEYRFWAEGLLLDHAMRRPLVGWGGHARHRPVNDFGEQTTRTDSLWIITLGRNGLFGVACLYAVLTVPMWVLLRRVPKRSLFAPDHAGLLMMGVMVSLFACDSLFNAMYSPVYVMAGGGVVATCLALPRGARIGGVSSSVGARSQDDRAGQANAEATTDQGHGAFPGEAQGAASSESAPRGAAETAASHFPSQKRGGAVTRDPTDETRHQRRAPEENTLVPRGQPVRVPVDLLGLDRFAAPRPLAEVSEPRAIEPDPPEGSGTGEDADASTTPSER